jgi:hypothetical protein
VRVSGMPRVLAILGHDLLVSVAICTGLGSASIWFELWLCPTSCHSIYATVGIQNKSAAFTTISL